MIVFRDSADAAKVVTLPDSRIARALLPLCHGGKLMRAKVVPVHNGLPSSSGRRLVGLPGGDQSRRASVADQRALIRNQAERYVQSK